MTAGDPFRIDWVPLPGPAGLPLAWELVPAPDPWRLALCFADSPHLVFLDSAERHRSRGRYSYLAADPVAWFDEQTHPDEHAPLEVLRRITATEQGPYPAIPDLPPFQGGLAGFFGYELNRLFEPSVAAARYDEFRLPRWALGLYDWVVSFDHAARRAWFLSTGAEWLDSGKPRFCRSRALSRMTLVRDRLQAYRGMAPRVGHDPDCDALSASALAPQYALPGYTGVTSNFDRSGYEAVVRRAVEYVHAGDCFQVNLSQRLLARVPCHPLELYGRLRERNPAPFAGYLDLGGFQIASASPERFLRVDRLGNVQTRPIKGTRPRGVGTEADADAAVISDLLTNPKDRAENVMIVDLLRNDLGRVCRYGSVIVPRVCEVETFRFVHHLVSEVRGRLKPGIGAAELLTAAFPGGSVTGAPKVRAMQIIAELEPTVRGPYCGSLGWFGFDGALDTNILIRTFTAGRGWLQFPVGGGIVADSEPAREYEETLHKAAGLLQSLGPLGTDAAAGSPPTRR